MKRIWWGAVALASGAALAVAAADRKPALALEGESNGGGGAARMSVERAAHQATVLSTGEVLVSGGCSGPSCGTTHSSAELFDPASRSFRLVAPMTADRASHAAVALPDGRALIVGGWSGRTVTATAEIYDPATARFTAGGRMLEARAGPAAVVLADGRVLLVGGGAGAGAGTALASAEIFDPATATFAAAGEMNAPRGAHTATLLRDGRVLVTGGHQARRSVLRSAEIFDPATGRFSSTGDLAVPRHKHAAALLPDGTVLIVGGSDERDSRGRYSSTEIYDPQSGRFSPGPELHFSRYKIPDAVAVLADGSLIIGGGAVRPERWDASTGRFAALADQLSGPLMFATASTLHSGDVLIVGGYDDRIESTSSAWLLRQER